jgi:aminoglycoside phosphotransferase (APT) family kinase protein
MEFVNGFVLRRPEDAVGVLDEPTRSRVGMSMVAALRALHAIQPETVGLGDLGRREDYIARQLKAWGRQLGDSRRPVGEHSHSLREIRDLLSRSIPHQQDSSIVHGDYRLDNVIISNRGDVKAVLDWELCTLGDPMADVATLALYWSDPDDDFFPLESATIARGFLRRAQVIDAYRKQSTLDFSRFPYYLAFASWRLAVILEGVQRRYSSGAYGLQAEGEWDRVRHAVPSLVKGAFDYLAADVGSG